MVTGTLALILQILLRFSCLDPSQQAVLRPVVVLLSIMLKVVTLLLLPISTEPWWVNFSTCKSVTSQDEAGISPSSVALRTRAHQPALSALFVQMPPNQGLCRHLALSGVGRGAAIVSHSSKDAIHTLDHGSLLCFHLAPKCCH